MSTRHYVEALQTITSKGNTKFCWIVGSNGPRRVDEVLTGEKLAEHCAGRKRVGMCPMLPGESTTRLALLDFDSHKGEVEWPDMVEVAQAVMHAARREGLHPMPFRSSGGKGIHLLFMWNEPQDAYSVRELLREVLSDALLEPGTGGVMKGEVEIFPKQDRIPPDGYGSMFVLPLAGASVPLHQESLAPLTRDVILTRPWLLSKPVAARERPLTRVDLTTGEILPPDLEKLRAALAAIPNDEDDSLEYEEWRNVLFGIHHATGGSDEGLRLAREFSSRSPKYEPEFFEERVWPYIHSDRDSLITERTIYNKAREYGWSDPVSDDELGGDLDDEDAPAPAAQSEAPAKRERFHVWTEEEILTLPFPTWIVKGVLPKGKLGMLFGDPGAGKSFVILDLLACIARGIPWRGHKVKQMKVIYIAAEADETVRPRLGAYLIHHGVSSQVRCILDRPDLLKNDGAPLLKAIQAAGGADLVVIDTLAQVSPGGDENSSEDAGRVMANIRKVGEKLGAMMLVVHHTGKDPSKGARGWSGWKGAVDVELEVRREEHRRYVKVAKLKSGEDGAEYPFSLKGVDVGVDEDGDTVTSCVVEHLDEEEAERRREPRGSWERLVWRALNDIEDLGEGSTPTAALIDAAIQGVAHDPEKRDRRREQAARAINSLAAQRFLVVEGEVVRRISA